MSVVFFLSFFLMVQISLPYKRMGKTNDLYMFILETSGGNFVYKCSLEFPLYEKMFLVLVEHSFHFHLKVIDYLFY